MACVGEMKICMITTTCVTLHRLIGAKLDPTDPFSRIRRDSPTNISSHQNGSERAAIEGESNVKNGPSDAKNRISIR